MDKLGEFELNKIYCMDCLEGLKKIPDNSVDLVVTDPPYNISEVKGKKGWSKKGNKFQESNFGEWDYNVNLELHLKEFARILKKGGSLVIFTSDELFGKITEYIDKFGLRRLKWLAWHKTNPTPSFRKVTYLTSGELIIFAIKKISEEKNGHTFNFKKQNEMHNIINLPICQGKERSKHPTQKPLKLIKHFIEIHSNPNDIVLDAFMGAGTTAVACKELGRKFIGFEISPEYCKIANERLNQEVLNG